MRLLLIMESYPLPMRTGSTIIALNTLRELSSRHDIDLICLEPKGSLIELGSIVRNVHLVQSTTTSPLLRFLKRILFWISPRLDFRGDRNFRQAIRTEVNINCYDAIMAFELGTVKHCPRELLNSVSVHAEDAQSLRLLRMSQLPVWSFNQRLKLRIVAWLTHRYERATFPKLKNVFLLSTKDILDINRLERYPNLVHVPYGVDQRLAFEIRPYRARRKVIIYSGNMFHPPNVDGALFLLKEIFPLILKEEPSAILSVVGADPDERIIAAAKAFGTSVEITGRVADLAGYLASAAVSVCPIRLHIGVQTKVLESMSFGTPVVTTSAGNRGVGGTPGKHLYVEDSPVTFAARVCDLLRGERWDILSHQGRLLTEQEFSWSRSAQVLERRLQALPEISQ